MALNLYDWCPYKQRSQRIEAEIDALAAANQRPPRDCQKATRSWEGARDSPQLPVSEGTWPSQYLILDP